MAKSQSITKTLGLVLIGMLILGLGGFGVTNFSGNVRAIGAVGDTDIAVNDYARALQSEMRAYEAQSGQALTFQQAQSLGLTQQVLAQQVVSAALKEEARNLGISLGDERLAQALANIEAFQGADGTLDRVAYAAALERVGLSERDFEAQLRGDNAASILQGAVLGSTTLPDTYTDTLIAYAGERRGFSWVELGAEALSTGLPVASEDNLKAWYDANIDRFILPETKVITYASLTPDQIVDTVEVDAASLRAAYDERAGEFNLPERRLVERLGFADDAAAQAAADRIASGAARFEDLVSERGLDLADTDLGDVTQDALGAAGEAVFAAETGAVVGPAPSDLGPALFRVNAVLAAQATSFEEAEPALRDTLALDKARRVIEGLMQSLDDELAAGATLEELAETTDMTLGQINWTAASAEGIAGYEAFNAAAALLSTEDFPQIDTLGDGGIFAMRLDEIRDPAPQPFEDVQTEVAQGWERQAQAEALLIEAKALVTRLDAGESAEELGLSLTSEAPITRSNPPADLPPALLEQVFALDDAGTAAAIAGNGVAYLVRLDTIEAADPNSDSMQTLAQIYGNQAAGDVAQDLFRALASDIQSRAGVTIDQQAINAVHAQFQ